MSTTTLTMLLAGGANLLPALFFMFTALLGSNGMNSAQGGQLLGTLAVLLVLGWLAALWLARHLAHWCQARGWSTVASVAAAQWPPSPCWRWCPPWWRCCGWGHERAAPHLKAPSNHASKKTLRDTPPCTTASSHPGAAPSLRC